MPRRRPLDLRSEGRRRTSHDSRHIARAPRPGKASVAGGRLTTVSTFAWASVVAALDPSHPLRCFRTTLLAVSHSPTCALLGGRSHPSGACATGPATRGPGLVHLIRSVSLGSLSPGRVKRFSGISCRGDFGRRSVATRACNCHIFEPPRRSARPAGPGPLRAAEALSARSAAAQHFPQQDTDKGHRQSDETIEKEVADDPRKGRTLRACGD